MARRRGQRVEHQAIAEDEHLDVDRPLGGADRGQGCDPDPVARVGHQHLDLPVRRRRRQGRRLAGEREILPEDPLEVVDDRPDREHIEVVVHARMRAPVDPADDRLDPVDDQELHVVDGQPLHGKRHHPDAALFEFGPDGPAAALGRVLDGGDGNAAVVGIEQEPRQVGPLKLVELEVDRVSRVV